MRQDGFRLKNADPMYTLGAYFMSKRTDAMNMVTLNIPEEPIHNYINRKRKEGINISHMAVYIAAYLRTVAKYPELNRFIVNKRFYHRNEISVGMVVLKSGIKGDETMSKLYFEPDQTVFDVNRIIEEYIAINRQVGEVNSMDVWIRRLMSLSGLVSAAIGLIKWLDKHGWLPKAIIDASPFHSSLLITNLASIRTNHIYHHVYEFGTTSISFALGTSREVPRRNRKTGEMEFIKCTPIGCVTDERIATGSYFASAFRYMQKHLANPELLEEAPDEIVYDPNVKDHKEKMAKIKAKRDKKKNK